LLYSSDLCFCRFRPGLFGLFQYLQEVIHIERHNHMPCLIRYIKHIGEKTHTPVHLGIILGQFANWVTPPPINKNQHTTHKKQQWVMNYRQKITSLCVPSPLNRKRTDKNRKDEKRFYLLQVLKGQEVDVCVCGVIIIVFLIQVERKIWHLRFVERGRERRHCISAVLHSIKNKDKCIIE
jgi:hypothetical protein